MKFKLVIYLPLFVFSSSSLLAQEKDKFEPFPNIIKINPISMAFGNINVSYERALSKSTSLQIGANYWYRIFGEEVNGIGVRAGYRFYVTNRVKSAPIGFYVGPQISYNALTDPDSEDSVSAFGIGVMLGYQWVFRSGVSLDLGAGPIYQFAKESSTGDDYEGFLPNFSFAIGYNF